MNFLLFGTLWFWILCVVTSGTIIWLLEDALTTSNDEGGGRGATIVLLIFGALYYFFGSSEDVINILVFVRDHPLQVFGYFLGYVGVGVIWAFIKWYFYVHNQVQKDTKKLNEYEHHAVKIPTASQNKYRIMSWMYYWPFSGLWTIINEPLKNSFEYVYTKIGGTFDSISNKMFADVLKLQQTKRDAYEKKKRVEEAAFRERQQKKQQLNS